MTRNFPEVGASTPQTLHEVLRGHALRNPLSPVLVEPGLEALNYAQLWQQVERFNADLNERGLGRGDRVVMVVKRPSEAMAAFLSLGCSTTVVALNPAMTRPEFETVLDRIRPAAVVFSGGETVLHESATARGVMVLSLLVAGEGRAGELRLQGGAQGQARQPGLAQPDDMLAILMSSGTTGTPKAVPIRQALSVTRSLANGLCLELSSDDVCLNFRPPYLSGPLGSGLILPILFGGAVVAPDGFDADSFYAALRDHGVTWYMGGPVYQEAILARAYAHAAIIATSRLRFIRAGSYPLSTALHARLESTFGVPCIEAYGSTESGVITSNPLPPGRRKQGTVGRPIGCEVVIRDSSGRPAPANEPGEVTMRGPGLFEGYLDEPERTAAVMVEGWYKTGDLGAQDSEGYLTILGRLNEIINRGGQKVSPTEVETVLGAHPQVRGCVCFGATHPTLGQMVVAAVAADPADSPGEGSLRAFARDRLSEYKVPTRIVVWPEIPRGPLGKPLRKEAAERFESMRGTLKPLGETDLTVLESTVAAVWGRVLGHAHIDKTLDFFEAGGDSLRVEELLSAITETHGVSLPFEIVFEGGNTIEGMAAAIEQLRREQTPAPASTRQAAGLRFRQVLNRLLRRPRFDGIPLPAENRIPELVRRMRLISQNWPGTPLSDRIPLFCLNAEGAKPPLFWCFNGAEEPSAMARRLGPQQPIFALRSLNRVLGERLQRPALVSQIARIYTDELVRLQPAGAFLLGGNCQSGEFAEAIAHELLARGRQIALLALLDHEAKRPFPGRIALFFGAKSRKFNPFLNESEPEARWRAMHAQPVWDIVPGDHGQYFRPPCEKTFLERLEYRIAEALASDSNPTAANPERQLSENEGLL